MERYSAKDIIDLAIRMETNGERFFREASAIVKHDFLQRAFTALANDERKHRDFFLKLLDKYEEEEKKRAEKLKETENPEENSKKETDSEDDNEDSNLSDLYKGLKDKVFKGKDLIEKFKKVTDPMKFIEFAMDLERETIQYFRELRKITRMEDGKFVNEIIEEEKRHLTVLLDVKKLYIKSLEAGKK